MIPEPTPLPMPSLRTLGLVGLATAGVLVVKWWKKRAQPADARSRVEAKVLEATPVLDARRCTVEVPWVDVT